MKNNSVHLDGVLEAFKVLKTDESGGLAWASVVTLHPKDNMAGDTAPSVRYDRLHHDVQVLADKDSVDRLSFFAEGLKTQQESGSVFACSLDGRIGYDGKENFVVCDVKDLYRSDLVKTNGNNQVNVSGEVVSAAIMGENAKITVKVGDVIIESHVSRREHSSVWDMVAGGSLKKGNLVSFSGPLLSQQYTDGKQTMRSCSVSPHLFQKIGLDKKTTRKTGPVL